MLRRHLGSPTLSRLVSSSQSSSPCLRACLEVSLGSHITSSYTTQTFQGRTGLSYMTEKVIQDRGPFEKIFAARCGTEQVVIKDIPQDVSSRLQLYARIQGCRNVRCIKDVVEESKFVFEYLDHDLLQSATSVSGALMKIILKSALTGLAALHQRDVVHTNVKADSIMFNMTEHTNDKAIDRVEIIDLENAIELPPGAYLVDAPTGNIIWRSPEANALGPLQKPSDLFSFGLVCIYAVAGVMPLFVKPAETPAQEVANLWRAISLQLIMFADPDSFDGFMEYLDVVQGKWENSHPKHVFQELRMHCRGKYVKHEHLWSNIGAGKDEIFQDLIGGLTNFDPRKRLTAQQALDHEWFRDVIEV